MTSGTPIRAIDVHSHWSTKRGYPLQTEAELSRLQHTWRAELIYRGEAEMAEDFRQAGVRTILDFGYTKYLTIDEVAPIHDYGFEVQQAHADVIIGNWVHFQPVLGGRRSLSSAAVSSALRAFSGWRCPARAGCRRATRPGTRSIGYVLRPKCQR